MGPYKTVSPSIPPLSPLLLSFLWLTQCRGYATYTDTEFINYLIALLGGILMWPPACLYTFQRPRLLRHASQENIISSTLYIPTPTPACGLLDLKRANQKQEENPLRKLESKRKYKIVVDTAAELPTRE